MNAENGADSPRSRRSLRSLLFLKGCEKIACEVLTGQSLPESAVSAVSGLLCGQLCVAPVPGFLVDAARAYRITGGRADDMLRGADGNDVLRGGFGSDQLAGDDGLDQLFGEEGPDRLDGGADGFHDVLFGFGNTTRSDDNAVDIFVRTIRVSDRFNFTTETDDERDRRANDLVQWVVADAAVTWPF